MEIKGIEIMDMDLHLRRKYLLSQSRFYGILDTGYVASRDLERVTSLMIDGGVQIIQLRAKEKTETEVAILAERLRKLFFGVDVLFIVNDHPQVAADVGADGVHLGQDDMDIQAARLILRGDQLVGQSTHSLEQAVQAEIERPDYIGVGPIFATPTKPDYVPVGIPLIREVKSRVSLPQFCIGGINLENLSSVIAAGADRVVMVSGILNAADTLEYCRAVNRIIYPKGLIA